MAFTKSLLIKALGGVAGVGGTTVGVLAGTGVLKPETNTPAKADKKVVGSNKSSSRGKTDSTQKNPSDNDSIESDSVKGATKEQDSIQGGSSVGQESIQTGSVAPEEGAGDHGRVSQESPNNTNDQQRDGVSGGGNLPSNPVQSPGDEVQNRSTDVPGGLPSSSNVVENTLENGVSQEKQKGEGGKDSVETVNTKENVSERQGTPQPGTGSLEGQTSDPNNAQNGVQTAQDGQGNGLGGSQTNPGSQSSQQPVSEGQNSPNTLPSAVGEGENKTGGSAKEQQDSIQEGSRGQGSLQPGAENSTNPDSDANSHGVKTDDRSQQVDSGLPKDGQKGQGGDEHCSDSASEISEPVSSNNPVQGADNVDTNPQLSGETATTTPTSGEEQKASVVNTGVNVPKQSDSTLQTASPGAPAGTDDGNSGGSSLPNTGGTPGAADTQNLGTGGNGAPGSTPSNGAGTEGGNGGDGTTSEGSELPDSLTTNTVTQTPTQSQSKEAKINAQLKTLGVPDDCNFSQNDTSKTCSINKEELNKMKFNNGSSVSGSVKDNVENLQLKIEILTGSKKTAYGINNDTDEEEENDVTKDLLFTFSGFNDEINLDSDDAFKIYPKTNPEFKAEDDGLEKVWDQAVNLAEKVGINKKSPHKFESTTTLKYSLDSGTTINTLNSPTTSGTIDVEPDKENYNQGVKVTFRGKVTGTGADPLDANTSYEIKYDETESWYLSLVEPKVTQSTGQLTQ